MALTGQAKTDYQREYMRRRRGYSNYRNVNAVRPQPVRPVRPKMGFEPMIRAELDADGNAMPDSFT